MEAEKRPGIRIGIVNVNLQYNIPKAVLEGMEHKYLQNIELPPEYVEDSFEVVKIISES